jgi:DNA polymerase
MQHALKFDPDTEMKNAPRMSGSIAYDAPQDLKHWSGMVLVGEAPGAEEVRQGHPFVGRSGQLLDKILEKAEIVRRECLIANVFRFQPPGNKVDHFFISRRAAKEQNIAIAEQFGQFGSAWCRGEFAPEIAHLQETLEKIKPKIIVSLGRTPLWALTGENGLMGRIGKHLPCRLMPSVQVIPTYHPSFILRGNWGLQDGWLSHFLAAKGYCK